MPNYLTLSFPGCVCLFWFIVIACRWKKNFRSQKIFALTMLVMAVSFYVWNIYFDGLKDYNIYYIFDCMDSFFTLLIHPLIFLFFKSFTDERPLSRKDYLWLLPAVFIGGGTALLYWIMGEENAILFVKDMTSNRGRTIVYTDTLFRIQNLISIRGYNFVLYLQIIATTIYAVRSLFLYHRKLNEFYSNLDGKSINTSFAILISFSISLLFSLLTISLGSDYFLVKYPDYSQFAIILWGGALNFLGFQVASLHYTAEDLAADIKKADMEAEKNGYLLFDEEFAIKNDMSHTCGSTEKRHIDTQLSERFNQLIDTGKIYLQSELRLDEVARMMCTNRTYISRLINDEHQCSFSDFINRKRIEYAKDLMRTDPNMKQEHIAKEAGFLHSATFSRIFKQMEGMTFREWQKKI